MRSGSVGNEELILPLVPYQTREETIENVGRIRKVDDYRYNLYVLTRQR
jgi:hypothetical protein